MVERTTNVTNFARTTLTSEMGATATVAMVADTTGFPDSPAILVLEPESSSRREVVLFDGDYTAESFSMQSPDNRYLEGSAAISGIVHPVGATIICAPLAQHFDEMWTGLEGAVGDMEATGDTYIADITALGDGATTDIETARTSSIADVEAAEADAVAAVEEAAGDFDPSLYAKLDGTQPFTAPIAGVTPTADAELATKGYVDTAAEGSTDAVTAHEGATDPHSQYLTEAEGNAAYEAKVDRTGAAEGDVPTLQGDGTLAFASGGSNEEIFVSAGSLAGTLGTPTLQTPGTAYNWAAWTLDDSSTEAVVGHVLVPAGWSTVATDVWWVQIGTGSGDVGLGVKVASAADGGSLGGGNPAISGIPAAGQGVPTKTTYADGTAVSAGDLLGIRVQRVGGSTSEDTLDGDIGIIGFTIRKVS